MFVWSFHNRTIVSLDISSSQGYLKLPADQTVPKYYSAWYLHWLLCLDERYRLCFSTGQMMPIILKEHAEHVNHHLFFVFEKNNYYSWLYIANQTTNTNTNTCSPVLGSKLCWLYQPKRGKKNKSFFHLKNEMWDHRRYPWKVVQTVLGVSDPRFRRNHQLPTCHH